MNWSELNRKLDERLAPEDALLLVQEFNLDPDKFSAMPTLREIVQAGDLSLGDVARILHVEENVVEPDPVIPITVFSNELTREEVIDGGVTNQEAEWLTKKFGLADKPPAGTPIGQIVEDYELDPDIVANSLTQLNGAETQGVQKKRLRRKQRRLVDLDNPSDVSRVYDEMIFEKWRRSLPFIVVFIILMPIIYIAIDCQSKAQPDKSMEMINEISRIQDEANKAERSQGRE